MVLDQLVFSSNLSLTTLPSMITLLVMLSREQPSKRMVPFSTRKAVWPFALIMLRINAQGSKSKGTLLEVVPLQVSRLKAIDVASLPLKLGSEIMLLTL